MVQPASQPDLIPGTQGGTPLTAAIPAGSGDSAVTVGSTGAAGAVLPAPAIVTSPAAPNNPGTASLQIAATVPPAPALLVKLSAASLTYKVQGSRFESIAAETLNNAGTSDDGFDDMISPVVSAFGEDESALASLQGDLADSSFVPGEFTATVHAPITADIADFIAAGDSQIGTPAAAATPSAPAPPPSDTPTTGVMAGYGGPRGGDSPRIQKILPQGEDPSADDTTPVIM